MPSSFRSEQSRPVAIWLFAVAFLVFAMLVVGGATRLTGSGLSITEWKPVTGAIPPLSDAAWMAEFHKYQRIPQYQFVNRGMTLDAFKSIYWWEWAHRLLGRALGVVFALPFVAFLLLRRLPRRLVWRCVGLFALGGLQGLVGWWMVASGLTERVKVAPERLATHLGLALILMVALIWTGLEAWAGRGRPGLRTRWALPAAVLAIGVYVQCLLGALVAGNDAGLVDNDWPLMGGRWFPRDYVSGGVWETLAHSQAAVQFNHRLLGYLVFAGALAFAVQAVRRRAPVGVRALGVTLAVLATLQAALGVATLMNQAPLALAAPHQAGAAIVLAAATVLAWRARRV